MRRYGIIAALAAASMGAAAAAPVSKATAKPKRENVSVPIVQGPETRQQRRARERREAKGGRR